MSKIAIIGYGNVGFHFAKVLSHDHHVSIYSRNPVEEEINALDSFKADGYDFVIISVSDDAIKKVAESFDTSETIVLHTSGTRPLADLVHHAKRGVIYPLQTFSREKEIDFNQMQAFIEASSGMEENISELAKSITPNIREVNSKARAKIHLAAVFACNFSNHMFHIAENFLKEVDLEFQDIRSLVEETVKKAMELNPSQSQTGPAIRGDVSTLALQENLIEDDRLKEVYRVITNSIQTHH